MVIDAEHSSSESTNFAEGNEDRRVYLPSWWNGYAGNQQSAAHHDKEHREPQLYFWMFVETVTHVHYVLFVFVFIGFGLPGGLLL